MMKFLFWKILLIPMILGILTSTALAQAPTGWIKAGSKPNSYKVGTDESNSKGGRQSCYLRSTEEKIKGFGTVMQSISPDKYRGERLRLTGYLKTENVDEWAGLWMRVDGEDSQKSLAFDNMQNRAAKGTGEWRQYAIVLDVAEQATSISFGFLMQGTGQVWADGLKLEVVDTSVPTTNMMSGSSSANTEPQNLDFEK